MSLPILATYTALVFFSLRVWRTHGRLGASDRWALVTAIASSLTAFALMYAFVDWVAVTRALWCLAVLVLACGVAGAVLRWPDVSWLASPLSVGRAVRVTATFFVCSLALAGVVVSVSA